LIQHVTTTGSQVTEAAAALVQEAEQSGIFRGMVIAAQDNPPAPRLRSVSGTRDRERAHEPR
jgi:hypothetical protein